MDMGCNHSKVPHQSNLHILKSSYKDITAAHGPCIDAAAVADLYGCQASVISAMPQQPTSIQDLPPLLLAHIFSKYLSWEDIHGSISQVCKSWHQVAAEVTPQQLSFEFDSVNDAALNTQSKAEVKSILQLLVSQPSKLLQRLTGQLRQPQDEQQQDEDGQDTISAADQLQEQQFMQFLQNAPWERWVHDHGMQLQDFSISITSLDSNCATAQCQLKETLLRALADSTTPKTGLASRSSFSSSSSSSTPRASDSTAGSEGTSSAPVTPLSSTCSEFSDMNSSDSAATYASSTATTTSTSSSISSLQLKSLHLQVPLFECDVLLLAHGVCAKAPDLKALSLVGYSNSGAVKTRSNTAITTSGKSSRHRLPIKSSSRNTHDLAAAAATAAAATGSHAPPRGSDLIPVGNATSSSSSSILLTSLGSSMRSWSLNPPGGRGGFITGSSLKQLMASVPQLESLTFACRQLYKLNWLTPATQLTYLSLHDCSLGGDLVKQLAGLNLPKLRAVDLSGSRSLGGAEAAQHLQQLTRISGGQLEWVDISGWDLSSAGGASRVLPHLTGLQSLSLLRMECCGLNGWAVQCGQLPALTSLSLSGNPLDAQGIAAVCSMSQLQHLELAQVAPKELALLPLQPPGQGPACWSGMAALPHLTSLNLSGNFWPDVSVPDRSPVLAYRAFKHTLCSSIAGMSQLARVNLTECKAPYSRTMHLLANLPDSVTELVLDRAVDGIKRADVEALQQLPKLRVLSACGCNVRDKHAGVLSGLSELRSLILRDNALGPDGLWELLEGCSQLTLLDVTGNEKVSSKECGVKDSSSSSSSSSGKSTANVFTAKGVNSHLLLLRD